MQEFGFTSIFISRVRGHWPLQLAVPTLVTQGPKILSLSLNLYKLTYSYWQCSSQWMQWFRQSVVWKHCALNRTGSVLFHTSSILIDLNITHIFIFAVWMIGGSCDLFWVCWESFPKISNVPTLYYTYLHSSQWMKPQNLAGEVQELWGLLAVGWSPVWICCTQTQDMGRILDRGKIKELSHCEAICFSPIVWQSASKKVVN